MTKLKVLITGCAGYIGSRFCQLYGETYDITGVDNLYYGQGPLVYDSLREVRFVNADITKIDLNKLVYDQDIIIWLAALVGAPICEKKPEESKQINLDMVKKLCNVPGHKRVIFPNTNSAYGQSTSICTEESPTTPLSGYAEQKNLAEKVLINSVNATVFRLATVFGLSPRMRLDLLINSLVWEAATKGKIEVFDGGFMRNYVHVDDVCAGLNFAIVNYDSMKGQVYNLGNDYLNCSKLSLAKEIGEIAGVPVEEKSDKTDGDKRDYIVSSGKLFNHGFFAKKSLPSAVADLLLYYRNLSSISPDTLRMMRNF